MTYSCIRCDDELLATFAGDLVIGELLEAMEEFGRLDEGQSTTHSILDMTDVSTADLAVEEMHRFAATVRLLFPRTREHRFAVVAPTPVTQTLVRDYIQVRNTLAIRPTHGPNEVAVFTDVPAARRWGTRVVDPPSPVDAWP